MVGFRPADVPPSAAVKFVGAGTAACIADLLTFPLDTAKVRLQVLKYSCVTNTKPILVTLVAWTFIAQIQGEARGSAATWSGSAVKYRGVFGTIATMVRTEGPLSLYSGLVAGLQRQMSFASVRIGLYDSAKQFYTKGSDREHLWLDSDSCLFGWGEILTSLNWHLSLPGLDVGIGSRLLAGSTTGALAVAIAQPTDVVKVRFQAQARSLGRARRYCSTVDAYRTIAKEEGICGLWKGSSSFQNAHF